MPGVPRELAEHTLNIDPKFKPIKQFLRRFNEERRKAIGEEVARLLAAGFIRITRHGHKRRCFLFAVTWLPVDDCDGKGLEVASERVACDWWKTEIDRQKRAETPSETSGKPSPNRVSNRVIRSQQAGKPLFIE